MCRVVLAAIAVVLLGQAAVAETPVLPTVVTPTDGFPQVCPRPDAPYAATPVGLVDSPRCAIPSVASASIGVNDCLVVAFDQKALPVADAAMKEAFGPSLYKMAVTVVSVRPNGVLVLEGRNEVLSDGKVYSQHLTGEVRPEAVRKGNLVRLEDIAERRLRVRTAARAADAPEDAVVQPNPIRQVAAEMVVPSKEAELRAKLVELEKLQQEIHSLQAETKKEQIVAVRVQMLEVSLTKLRQLGISFGAADPMGADGGGKMLSKVGQTPDSKALEGLVEWMQKNDIARVVTRPQVMTANGRAASVHVGDEVEVLSPDDPTSIEYKKVGLQLDVLPKLLEGNRVRLELKLRLSELDEAHSQEVNGAEIPAITVRGCDTAIESPLGHSTVLNGLVESVAVAVETEAGVRDEQREVAMIVVITPELAGEVKATPKLSASLTRE